MLFVVEVIPIDDMKLYRRRYRGEEKMTAKEREKEREKEGRGGKREFESSHLAARCVGTGLARLARLADLGQLSI